MATSNTDDLRLVGSPLDLSQKVNIVKSMNDNDDCPDSKSTDGKSVSTEELLSLKLLHDRLRKTMEILLPQEKLKKCEELRKSQMSYSSSRKNVPDFDYRAAMKALLSLVESDPITSNDDDDRNMTSFPPTNISMSHADPWSYWHDYILSLYLMNSSATSSLAQHPPIPPLPLPMTSMFPPPFNFQSQSQNSVIFQNMLNNIINKSPVKPTQNENTPKTFLPQESLNHDFGYKSKKLNSYQFLKDSNILYNSFAGSRNLGLNKTKLLDSPESFGVSLRGNQKYSIYYQQRPNNIFNNNFLSPNCPSTAPSKTSPALSYRNLSNNGNPFSNEESCRKVHMGSDIGHKRYSLSNSKMQKSLSKNDVINSNSKKISEKVNKFHNSEHGNNINHSNTSVGSAGNSVNFDNLPVNINLSNRYKETVFNCSCGQEFENLYAFTIHMKSTNHIPPNSSKIERSIPKLVRGQDMWINSETEQTKEILRCMRCHQSFRTLPELTMHMVETNHYSEIVYSDTGKCVFLNSEHDKVKPSYTAVSSPMSSPDGILRKLKRTLSSSTGSDIGIDDDSIKKTKMSSPNGILEDYPRDSHECLIKEEELPNIDVVVESTEGLQGQRSLQIKEADSGTAESQVDSDNYPDQKDLRETKVNSTNSSDSVIRLIENFVEKSLPKPTFNEYNTGSSMFCISNHKPLKTVSKGVTPKLNSSDKSWKLDSKSQTNEKTDLLSKSKEKSTQVSNRFNYKNYSVSSSDNAENPLSSLQTLVEAIQKNTSQFKDQGANPFKVSTSQAKEMHTYADASKSPIVSDSLTQLQALVAGTSVNNGTNPSALTNSNQSDSKSFRYSLNDTVKSFPHNDNEDSSASFISWCHKLGELLGLPQALSQAMLTQDAIKDLTNSVLMMSRGKQSSLEAQSLSAEENNNSNSQSPEAAKILSCQTSDSEPKSFQGRDADPIEQLKNLLNSTSEIVQSNHSQLLSSKHLNGPNLHSMSPPALSKKAKCHFCHKPFANKGQVRLHISKGKCPSLLRSCNVGYNQMETLYNGSVSPIESMYQFKEANDVFGKCEYDTPNSIQGPRDSATISNKSVNLIREYFKFAKQMIGNDELQSSPPSKFESKVE